MRPRAFFLTALPVALSLLACTVGRADERAETLLREAEKASKSVTTLAADLTLFQLVDGDEQLFKGTVKLKRPNLARLDFGKPLSVQIISDGKSQWLVRADRDQVTRLSVDAAGRDLRAGYALPVLMFFDMQPTFEMCRYPGATTRYVGREKVDDRDCQVVTLDFDLPAAANGDETTTPRPRPDHYTLTYYIGPSKLIVRVMQEVRRGSGSKTRLAATLKNLRLNIPLPDSDFAFTPPAAAHADAETDEPDIEPVGAVEL